MTNEPDPESPELESEVVAMCREHLAARKQWKETPELIALVRGEEGPTWMPLVIVPDAVWTMVEPGQVLQDFAATVAAFPTTGPRGLIAVALRAEAHTVVSGASLQADEVVRREVAGGSRPPLAEVPGSIEQRLLWAVDVHGRHYYVSADRNPDGTATPPAAHELHEQTAPAGTIPDSLASLIHSYRPTTGIARRHIQQGSD